MSLITATCNALAPKRDSVTGSHLCTVKNATLQRNCLRLRRIARYSIDRNGITLESAEKKGVEMDLRYEINRKKDGVAEANQ